MLKFSKILAKMEKINQLNLFELKTLNYEIAEEEISTICKKSKSMSGSIAGAIQRLIKAKRYHEVTNQLSQEVLKLRIENEKLKDVIYEMQEAN